MLTSVFSIDTISGAEEVIKEAMEKLRGVIKESAKVFPDYWSPMEQQVLEVFAKHNLFLNILLFLSEI